MRPITLEILLKFKQEPGNNIYYSNERVMHYEDEEACLCTSAAYIHISQSLYDLDYEVSLDVTVERRGDAIRKGRGQVRNVRKRNIEITVLIFATFRRLTEGSIVSFNTCELLSTPFFAP